MDIHETARRLWIRWPVIAAFVVAGAVAGGLLHSSGDTTYTSTVRVLAADDAFTTPGALADELLAIATTSTRLEKAIADSGAERAPEEVAAHVTVDPMGESPVLAVSVSDADAAVAAALANSLAAQSVETLAPSGTDDEAPDAATSRRPAVIERAHPAQSPDQSRLIPDVALGLFLGALLGVGAAALLETVRPTLVGPRYIAAEFGTRPLGDATPPSARTADGSGLIAPMLATRIGYAAARADVRTVWLVAVDPLVNIEPLAADLRATLPEGRMAGEASGDQLTDDASTGAAPVVKVWAPYRDVFPDPDSKWSGVVIVAPHRLPRSSAEPVREIIDLVSAPVLGLVAYES